MTPQLKTLRELCEAATAKPKDRCDWKPYSARLVLNARLSPEVVLRVYEAILRARSYAESAESTPTNLKISGALTTAIEELDGQTSNGDKA